jgi:putative peptidoglycan lipid II flippase
MTRVVNEEADKARMARAAGLVSGLTAISRVLGLARELVFAASLGAGLHADAFRIAFRIPNLLRDLFAEGALSAAFVPTFARALREHGAEGAYRLASRVLTAVGVVLGALVLAGVAFAPQVVALLAPGFDAVAGKAEVAVRLTRVMMPFLPLVAFAAVAMGMLNAQARFGRPAFAPAMFNVVTIACGLALLAAGLPPGQVALGWALATLGGGAAQFLIQVPPLRRMGWSFRPEWAPADPGLRRMAALMLPATAGLGAVQVNIFVNSVFASHQPGAVSWLDYAFRILYLPIGLFGVALGTIATSTLSRRAAEGDLDGLRATLRQALSTLLFLTVPATVGLALLAVPVVRLLYERGRFSAADTEATGVALTLYALGLVGYTGVKVLAPAFYALGMARVPALGSVLAVGVNLAVVIGLFPRLEFRAVALGTCLGSLANAAWLFGVFEARVGGLAGHGLLRGGLRMLAASAVMAPLAWGAARGLETALGTGGFVAQLGTGLVPVGVGVLAYVGAARAFGIPEIALMRALWRRSH